MLRNRSETPSETSVEGNVFQSGVLTVLLTLLSLLLDYIVSCPSGVSWKESESEMSDKMVVVLTPMRFYRHRNGDVFAARFKALGLTAYGYSQDESIAACKKLFNKFIHGHRERGTLVELLNRSGVEWYWEDEYPANKPKFDNTNLSTPTRSASPTVKEPQWVEQNQPNEVADHLFATAA